MKRKILYVFMIASCISMFSMAGQKKEICSKNFYCAGKKEKPKPAVSKIAAFEISPVGFLYIGVE